MRQNFSTDESAQKTIVGDRLTTFIDSLNWQLPDYLKEVERRALAEEVPIIRRSMQSLLSFLMRARQPEEMLEIGTAVGFSGMLLCHYAGKNARLDTIEKVPQRIQAARENFARYGLDRQIVLWEGDAGEVLEEMVAQGRNYDFIFMDAAKGQYLHFLPSILALIKPGGMLVTDNVLQGGDVLQSRYAITKRDRTIHKRMREYLYVLTHSEELNTVILPVGDGVTLTTVC